MNDRAHPLIDRNVPLNLSFSRKHEVRRLDPGGGLAALPADLEDPVSMSHQADIVSVPFPGWHPAARVRGMADAWLNAKLETARRLVEPTHVELVAFAFASFREVGQFQQALVDLPDIGNVQVRHLDRGTLQIRVQCQSTSKLLDGLSRNYARRFDLVSREPHRIEIALRAPAVPAAEV